MPLNEVYNRKANGKLLLTSEYFVLDGAEAIALPTIFGQKMIVNTSNRFKWEAYNCKNEIWINEQNQGTNIENELLRKTFAEILKEKKIDSLYHFKTFLDFPNEWGLGSSSTFISLISDFFNLNPFKLNRAIFKGSGYDIACSFAENPIVYSNQNKDHPTIKDIEISNDIKPYLYFIYLGQKQNSRDAISYYQGLGMAKESIINELNSITNELINSRYIQDWIGLLTEHENIISINLKLKKVSETIVKGLPYFSKSLGAWGGDFAMMITDDDYVSVVKNVKKIGIDTIFRYNELILH